jgi:biopolymer transport protein ExbB/TolQ
LNFFNGLLNIFSDLLLGPVIAGEILLLAWALIHAGDCHAEWLRRLRTSRGWKRFEDELTHGPADLVLEVDPPKGRYRPVAALCSARAANWRDEHLRHIIDEVEIQGRKSLEASTTMTRLGPMFGLMGTLIPMGPALKGLAGGDLETMSANLQVAFSTTVVGVFIGGIGFLCRQVRQRWAMEDLRLSEWMLALGSAARKESESYAR